MTRPLRDPGCILWEGGTKNGYGSKYVGNGKYRRAHVLAYEEANGSVPDGLEVSHLCHQKLCVNPDHLVVETHKENVRRSYGPLCPKGHKRIYLPNQDRNRCNVCHAEASRRWRARQK